MALGNCNAGKCEQVGRQHNETCILAYKDGEHRLTCLPTQPAYIDTCRLGGTCLLRTYLKAPPAV